MRFQQPDRASHEQPHVFNTRRVGTALIRLHPFTAKAAGQQAHLRILATTDLHAHILPYDYFADSQDERLGLVRTAGLIEAARQEARNSLLVDNGDFLQGSPIGDFVAFNKDLSRGEAHPVIQAMNLLGYDAGTLGNHEFNYGISFLTRALAGADFPVVCANAVAGTGVTALHDTPFLPPYVILNRQLSDGNGESHPVRIGVIGFVPPQVILWDSGHLRGNIETRDIVTTAKAWVPQMKAKGADIVVALAHSGIGPPEAQEGMENAAIPLAAIAGVDAVIAGHTHLVFPSAEFAGLDRVDVIAGTISGKPAVMAGFGGTHLGLIDLLLERDGARWRVIAARSEARPVPPPDAAQHKAAQGCRAAAILRASATAHQETLTHMQRKVGTTCQPLHSYFALVANSADLQLVCQAQAWYVATMLKDSRHAHLPLLSAAAPFRAGGRGGPTNYTNIPAGDLELRNVADLYAFPNTIRAVRIKGWQVENWIERSAALFSLTVAGKPGQPLINPEFPSYQFDVMSGVTYEIDPACRPRYCVAGKMIDPAAARVRNLRYKGQVLNPEAEFIVATNSHRVGACPVMSDPANEMIVCEAPVTNRDIVMRYISAHQPLCRLREPGWRLTCPPGTSYLFDSSPRALAHTGDVTDAVILPDGPAPNGFFRFRLSGRHE